MGKVRWRGFAFAFCFSALAVFFLLLLLLGRARQAWNRLADTLAVTELVQTTASSVKELAGARAPFPDSEKVRLTTKKLNHALWVVSAMQGRSFKESKELRDSLLRLAKALNIYRELLKDLETSFGPLEEARKRAFEAIRLLMYNLAGKSQSEEEAELRDQLFKLLRLSGEEGLSEEVSPPQVIEIAGPEGLRKALLEFGARIGDAKRKREELSHAADKLKEAAQSTVIQLRKFKEAHLSRFWSAIKQLFLIMASASFAPLGLILLIKTLSKPERGLPRKKVSKQKQWVHQ